MIFLFKIDELTLKMFVKPQNTAVGSMVRTTKSVVLSDPEHAVKRWRCWRYVTGRIAPIEVAPAPRAAPAPAGHKKT